METSTINFDKNARRVYSAVRQIFMHKTKFSSVDFDDELYVIEARHGMWLSPFSENIKIKIVATGTQSSKAVIESSSRSVLNLLNFGANKGNVSDLGDYISNEVYKQMNEGEIKMVQQEHDHSTIRFAKPDIKLRQ